MNAAEKDLLRRLYKDWSEMVTEHCADNNMDWPQSMRDLAAEVESALAEPEEQSHSRRCR